MPVDPVALGRRVRRVRESRGLTLKQIEARVAVSAAHVSEIERGLATPTIGALSKLADALDVRLSSLIAPAPSGPLRVSRKAERPGYVLAGGDLVLEPLTSGDETSGLSVFLVTVAPHGDANPRPLRDWGEEALQVLDGRLDVRSGDVELTLERGDAARFRSTSPLRFRNPESTRARLVWGTTPGVSF